MTWIRRATPSRRPSGFGRGIAAGTSGTLDTIHILGAKKVESEPTLTLVKAGQVWDQKFLRAVVRYAWELREYPFDEHNFVIRFEDGLFDSETLIYIPDRAQSGIDPGAMGSRWNIGSFRFDAELSRSPTTYGDPTLNKPKSFSAQGVVTVYAERRQTVIFWKLLIGAYVALLLAMLSYRIKTISRRFSPRDSDCWSDRFSRRW